MPTSTLIVDDCTLCLPPACPGTLNPYAPQDRRNDELQGRADDDAIVPARMQHRPLTALAGTASL